jgi:hypothetical protein
LGTTEAGPGEIVDRSDPPFGRAVTSRLAYSLVALDSSLDAAKSHGDLSVFRDSVEAGVSADLCNAIGAIAEVGREREKDAGRNDVEISFAWSGARPVAEKMPTRFSVERSDSSVLRDASNYLRSLSPRPSVTITGRVVRLERKEDESEGSIGIQGLIEGERRVVTVVLKPADYARAIHAHELGLDVTCTGVLERSTHSRLEEPIEFIAPDTLFD